MKGFRASRKKHKTSTRRDHFWSAEEHKVFLDYCEDLRLACFHAIAMETGARPGELLQLKISDIKFKISNKGIKYSEFSIGHTIGSKMKEARLNTISESIPYFNAWVSVHPLRDHSEGAYLFPSRWNGAKYQNVPLQTDSLRLAYHRVIEEHFPKLLNRPDISLEDKNTLRSLIYDKQHHPYLRRHEMSTVIAPRVSQQAFNVLLGHSPNSKMYQVYVHDIGRDATKELLIAKGVMDREETLSQAQKELQSKPCPICHETNKHNAKLCFKCNFILSTEGYLETKAEEEKIVKELQELRSRQSAVEVKIETMFDTKELEKKSEHFQKLLKEYRLG